MIGQPKKLLSVLVCIGLVFLANQLSAFDSLNSFFSSRFQSYSLNKQNDFATIIVEQNSKTAPYYADWSRALEQIATWTDANIYVLDLFAQDEQDELNINAFNIISQKPTIHFVQSTNLNEDFEGEAEPLPSGIASDNVYSVNYPDFKQGVIRNYQKIENLHPDIIDKLYSERQQILDVPLTINYMIGLSYLPAVDFEDVLNSKVDERLFAGRSVLIINQANNVLPTVLSHRRAVTQSQYYGYLFETALQDLAIKEPSRLVVFGLLLILALFVLLINYSLANRIRTPLTIILGIGIIVLSFMTLGSLLVYLPVIEMLLAVLIPLFLLQQQDSANDKEQLALGTRLYNQILESSGKAYQKRSREDLLGSFSRFFCELAGANSMHYVLNHDKKRLVYSFNGSELQIADEAELELNDADAFEHSFNLRQGLSAQLVIDDVSEEFEPSIARDLLLAKESYIKTLLTHTVLEQPSKGIIQGFLQKPRSTKQHEHFKLTTDSFLSHYHLLKNHFESLQTASILYGVNGAIIQSNQAAEYFIRDNDIKLFNQNLITSLIQLTELEQKTIASALVDLVSDQDTVIIWPTRIKGLDKSYLLSLSAYTTENVRLGGFLIELFDIEEVNYIASLKNNFISEMNNTLRNDFSEVILALDFLAMGIEGGLTLEEVNAKVAEFSEKLQPSEMLMRSTNEIMRQKSYPVDIRELVAQGIKATSEEIEEKQIVLDIKQPRFINLVMVNYQHFSQICKQLLLIAVQDCMDEGKLSLVIQEIEQDQKRFVNIVITTKGYGIFDRERIAQDAQQDISGISELHAIDKYISSLGGHLELESKVGQGSKISTLLPCFKF